MSPKQGRVNHYAGCTMGAPAAARGPRSTAKFFPRCFDFECLNVTTKKVVNFFFGGGREKCTSREAPSE